MKIENCPQCGGTHYGSYKCPFTQEQIDKMKACNGQGNYNCPHMKESYSDMSGERYRCEVCGKSIWLDYEDMK